MKKNVLLAEDHPMISKALKMVINEIVSEVVFWEAVSTHEMMKLLHQNEIHFCIVDLHLADGLALESIERILTPYPEMNILVYSTLPDEMYAKRLLQAGVHGFVNKRVSESELVHALKKFFSGEFYISPEFLPLLLGSKNKFSGNENPFNLLSNKELMVAEYLREGLMLRDAADKMMIKQNTAATLKKRAFDKLNIDTVVQLLQLYQMHGGAKTAP
jgi:two-component system invasion response regulator UvrY